ncbi:MAG: hypothetical protein KAS39_08085 [Actinomycetia bacterium]|nr:hypothetical protein [Actinomycetes bacterium]
MKDQRKIRVKPCRIIRNRILNIVEADGGSKDSTVVRVVDLGTTDNGSNYFNLLVKINC